MPPLPADHHDYNQEAIALAESYGITLPLAEQPRYFLSRVWDSIPRFSTVGLSLQNEYFDKKSQAWLDTMSQEWLYNDALDNFDFAPIHAHNTRQDFHLPGMGSIYWQIASRDPIVRTRFQARGTLEELKNAGSFGAEIDCLKLGITLKQGVDQLLTLLPLAPSLLVFSGGGIHIIYTLSEPYQLTNRILVSDYKAQVTALFHPISSLTDSSVFEAARVLRLPGFINRKPDRAGAVARIIYDSDKSYSLAEIRAVAPISSDFSDSSHIFSGVGLSDNLDRDSALALLALDQINPDSSYDIWLKIGMGLKTSLGDLGLALWDSWSSRGHTYKPGECAAKWASFKHTLITLASVFYYAREANPNWQAGQEGVNHARSHVITPEIKTDIAQPITPDYLTRDQIRQEQRVALHTYLTNPNKTHMATYFLNAAPPGTGKTYALLQELIEIARDHWQKFKDNQDSGDNIDYRGVVAYATLFNDGSADSLIDHFKLPRNLVYFFESRNKNNCENLKLADIVASKGYSVKRSLCKTTCKFKTTCEGSGYLSQEKLARSAPLVIYRHQHMQVEEVIRGRKYIGIDETPLPILTQFRLLELKDFVLPSKTTQYEDQYPDQVKLLELLCTCLKGVISMNGVITVKSGEYPTEKTVKLGGRWLMQNLVALLNANDSQATQKLCDLDPALIRALSEDTLQGDSLEAGESLLIHWLWDFWSIFRHEYLTYWVNQALVWNSRLIPYSRGLRVYTMQGLAFTRDTKLVINDATPLLDQITGQPIQYARSLEDKQGRARLGYIYQAEIQPNSQVTVFAGSLNTRKSFKKPESEQKSANPPITGTSRTLIPIPLASGLEDIQIDPDSFSILDTPAKIQMAQRLITLLAQKHNNSLLVVTYKTHAEVLRRWVDATKSLSGVAVQWFGGLRGKNDFENYQAELTIGTHFIPPIELQIMAQVWYWCDSIPVSFEKTMLEADYPGYRDPVDKQPRAYRYQGYQDTRVNAIYLHSIKSEMWQDAERIRAETSPEPKFIYSASEFPVTPHVETLISTYQFTLDSYGHDLFKQAIEVRGEIIQIDYLKHLQEVTGCAESTALDSYKRVSAIYAPQASGMWFAPGNHSPITSFGKSEQDSKQDNESPLHKITRWLEADPTRASLADGKIATLFTCSLTTVRRARKAIIHPRI